MPATLATPPATLIRADEARALAHAVWLDCRFDLADPDAGARAHAAGHPPGSHHLHLERELSGPTHAADGAFRGRHPLPDRSAFATLAGVLGIAPGVPVVAFDAQGGVGAARAWWLLRWLGHAEVAVLDGGVDAWLAAGGVPSASASTRPGGPPYPASAQPALATIDAATLVRDLGRARLVDARAAERFRGEVEPLDAVAGHIPGALLRCFKGNLGPGGHFKPAAALRAEWAPLAAGGPLVHYCGSGVTACHNLLAQAHAGLGDGVLYPGSWSEWSADPARPVARGG